MAKAEQEGKNYSVTVDGPGLTLDRQVDEQTALRILAVVMGSGQRLGEPQVQRQGVDGEVVVGELSVGEYLSQIDAKNNRQRIAGILLYLQDYHGRSPIHKDEIPDWFQRAREPAPKNLNRDLRDAISDNLISEDVDRPDHYFITNTGRKKLSPNGDG